MTRQLFVATSFVKFLYYVCDLFVNLNKNDSYYILFHIGSKVFLRLIFSEIKNAREMQRGELLIGEGSRTRYGARILFIGGESSASEYCGRNEQKIEAYASSKMRLKYYFNGSRGTPPWLLRRGLICQLKKQWLDLS
jgi:hypothetical protein